MLPAFIPPHHLLLKKIGSLHSDPNSIYISMQKKQLQILLSALLQSCLILLNIVNLDSQKNTLGFVPYDRNVDEKEIKYSESAFVTLQAENFQAPKKLSPEVFDNLSVVSHEILDSGFTKIRKLPHKQDLSVSSEMTDRYINQSNLKNGRFVKSSIFPSLSGFSNDVTHIKSFGASTESPFEKVDLYPRYEFHSETLRDYPVLMKADGYTRSFGQLVIPKTRSPTASTKRDVPQNKDTSTYIIGHKQDTGSIKNNPAYKESRELDPYMRFTSETTQKYNKLNEIPRNLNCATVSRSGFTLCNKFHYSAKAKDEVSVVKQLHPLVAAYRMEKIKHAYAPKPTEVR